jgi:predicted transcriptional regulator
MKVLIELDAEQERRLRDLAAEVRRSEQDLCLEAVERYYPGK